METICGANCAACSFKENCRGCKATCGRPFGGTCVAAEYIKAGGLEAYRTFKQTLLDEVNALLKANDIPAADSLSELPGAFVNLPYPLPNGKTTRLLDDGKIYLGTQIEIAGIGTCYGVVADVRFILICSYSVDGSMPELITYQRR